MSDDTEDGETQTQARSSSGRSSSRSKRRRPSSRSSDDDHDSGYESSEGGDTKRPKTSSSSRSGKSSSSSRDTHGKDLAYIMKAAQSLSQVTEEGIKKSGFEDCEKSIKLIRKLRGELEGKSEKWMKRAEEITRDEDEVSARRKKTIEELKSGSAGESKSEDGGSKDGDSKEGSKDDEKTEDSKDGDK
ncbi:hypothetical protein I302_103785 [Kwoniella bestiolae CBS 10118]|uniref:Uncharacterized protein n=1 Tax=Kwoniella bestiolae CBS 10118 TaxID=1296100 RepID=A0A1B9G9C4_9TREE|nr:hypothetical protein I302_02489 [Kwoniella bestiolae CBS 10118]OCF27645.1 hypothetical protein I302_02489 [Kwoniella bestiolae CBS 10118]